MNKIQKAVETFSQGYNCSQAVLSVYSEELKIDKKQTLKIAQGFGAGMGRLQEVCGAVTGAFMVISLMYGSHDNADIETREKVYGLINEFKKRFENKNNSIICRDLLGVDLVSGDKQENVKRVKEVCPVMVQNAVEILEELIKEN